MFNDNLPTRTGCRRLPSGLLCAEAKGSAEARVVEVGMQANCEVIVRCPSMLEISTENNKVYSKQVNPFVTSHPPCVVLHTVEHRQRHLCQRKGLIPASVIWAQLAGSCHQCRDGLIRLTGCVSFNEVFQHVLVVPRKPHVLAHAFELDFQ